MTQPNLGQREAVRLVMEQRPNVSLHYQHDVTNQISAQGLFQSKAADPSGPVNRVLHCMIDPKHDWYDRRVIKTGRGLFMLLDASLSARDSAEEAEIDEPIVNDTQIVGISAYGLYWERAKVRWNGPGTELLGRQTPESESVDFAKQQGVYVLHNNGRAAYVGMTTDSLSSRLDYHNDLSRHARTRLHSRWDQFSWFGFCDVEESEPPRLKPMPSQIDAKHFVAILETVLIEALEPFGNAQHGNFLGPIYHQV